MPVTSTLHNVTRIVYEYKMSRHHLSPTAFSFIIFPNKVNKVKWIKRLVAS